MALSEFRLIERFFHGIGVSRDDVILGVGDDAALVETGEGVLALAVDTLIEEVHFPADAPPSAIGHKLLAVNLSDLAAMGAVPAWALLALTLPRVDECWLAGLRDGMHTIAGRHGLALIGGDTTRGDRISASVFIAGHVSVPLRRDGARAGDTLWISGMPGEAATGLACWQSAQRDDPDAAALIERLHRPAPRVALGQALHGVATAAVDVSDGLLADAAHISERSGLGIDIEVARVPISAAARALVGESAARIHALSGGDDYELLFTVPSARIEALKTAAAAVEVPVSRIGRVTDGTPGVRALDREGAVWTPESRGYRHFAGGGE